MELHYLASYAFLVQKLFRSVLQIMYIHTYATCSRYTNCVYIATYLYMFVCRILVIMMSLILLALVSIMIMMIVLRTKLENRYHIQSQKSLTSIVLNLKVMIISLFQHFI